VLEAAAARFEADERVTLAVHDLDHELPFDGPFDAVITSLAVHHVTDERKRTLYAEVARLLAPGGVLCNLSNAEIAARFVDRTIRKLKRLGVKVTGVLSDNGPEFRGLAFTHHLARLGIIHHRTPPRSPNHNAVCERFQGTALQECWRPAFHRRRFDRLTQLRAEIDTWLVTYNTRRPNHSDFMRGRTPRQVLDTHRRKQAA
jgi:transposase InsO family protein